MTRKSEIEVFAGSTSKGFAEKMCDYLGIELGKSTVVTFSEGNTYVKIEETVRSRDVYLVQSMGLRPNDEFVEILFWVDAFRRASANSVTVVMPYFSYAKGDKKDEPRVSIRARVCAECIELAGADRVVTMDLHSPQIQGFFKKPVDHLMAFPILSEYIKSLNIEDLVVVSPDSGFAKEARNYARYLGLPLAIADKEREGHDESARVTDIIGDVEGKNALIVDDFTISGGTLISLASELKARGARRICACLSHVLLNEQGIRSLESSDIELLISTDSVYNPHLVNTRQVKIISVAPLFADAIRRIHKKESISPLFDGVPAGVFRAEES